MNKMNKQTKKLVIFLYYYDEQENKMFDYRCGFNKFDRELCGEKKNRIILPYLLNFSVFILAFERKIYE